MNKHITRKESIFIYIFMVVFVLAGISLITHDVYLTYRLRICSSDLKSTQEILNKTLDTYSDCIEKDPLTDKELNAFLRGGSHEKKIKDVRMTLGSFVLIFCAFCNGQLFCSPVGYYSTLRACQDSYLFSRVSTNFLADTDWWVCLDKKSGHVNFLGSLSRKK